ncbi:MAG: hypothetical protein WCX16_01435 [Candidatus Omnitrophota bacterium]
MKVNYLKVIVAVVAVILFAGISVFAQAPDVRHIPGEITWVDMKLGKLQLEADVSPRTGEITEYRITENQTRVTDPTDEKFLTIADLQPGQHVIIDVVKDKEDLIVEKITANPRPSSEFQEAYGRVESLDITGGTLVLAERPRAGEAGESNLAYFVFSPQAIVAMHSPSSQPVQLVLKPGDLVKVEYVLKDGKQWARSVTLYSPQVISTVTTTTTTTMTQ